MKKIISIFLFFVMLLCGSGFYISWYVSLQAVRNSQRTLIANLNFSEDKVVKLIFSADDLKKNCSLSSEDEKEFEYNNQMYDIINSTLVGDSIYITCISDTEEDYLRDVAMSQIINSGDNSNGKELPIFKFRLDHFTNDFTDCGHYFILKIKSYSYREHKPSRLMSPYLNIASPPPWHLEQA